MSVVERDEGTYVADLIYGRGARPRTTAPEPALLPHLGARLCHPFTIEAVLDAVGAFAFEGIAGPPWPPLWEATLWGVANRADLADVLSVVNIVTPNHWRVLHVLRAGNTAAADALATEHIDIGQSYPPAAGAARLAPLLSRRQLDALLFDPAVDPLVLDPESLRSLLAAAEAGSVRLTDDWIDAALNGDWLAMPPEVRRAHLLPNLPIARRADIADALAGWVQVRHLPPDMRALWVSRIAPFVSSQDVWDSAGVSDDLEPVWRDHIALLRASPWPAGPWADVFRAHPEHEAFLTISRPHETTYSAPEDVLSRWMPRAAAAVERSIRFEDPAGVEHPAGEGPGPDDSRPTLPPEPRLERPRRTEEVIAPPLQPRRLQADVLLEESMKAVSAFIADQRHIIDVSIGHHARIRADADIEADLQEIFRASEADWITLPVWFHAPAHTQEGTLRVPRDPARDSTSASFLFTAPAHGRVLARIHVMRPGGGLLLQSAVLAGDVVSSVAEAEASTRDIELSVDVVAGDLDDPAVAGHGRGIITDRATGLKEQNGSPVEIDVSQLQTYLNALVHEIETAADRHGLDEQAVANKLVALAIAGQRLRAKFEAQLGELADASPLQIVSLCDGDVLPLELVYDGPALSTASAICPTWRQSLRDGSCRSCTGGGPDNDEAPARVCPMRFWSMSKVIERRSADARGGPFRVLAERSAGRPNLRSVEAVVVAASGRVVASEVTTLRDYAASKLHIPASSATNWAEWLERVRDEHPELLIAMPHNKVVAGGLSSALLLGEPADDTQPVLPASELLAGSVTEGHVQSNGERPGPVVLLLGCNTQYEAGRPSGFAGEFREKGAALTVGTIGELRADQAPLAARALLDRIARPPPGMSSMGDILLAARRHLLADGMIMALLLVANGDAEWLLSNRAVAEK